ncbi:MAG: restriction endonuclease subunit S [Nitrospirales bacterium]|nr:restriction endonuclease subunit S [Nitrospirales bacterium]
MNPAQLLAHFNRIGEAPEAIPRLRHFILDLAVRGKLVEQVEPRENFLNDYINEPTSEELPSNWRLLNFGKFCDIQGGNQPPKSQFLDEPRPGYVRLFQIRDLGESPVPTYIPEGSTNRFCRGGEILIGRYGASVGKIFWAQDGAYNVALAKLIYPQTAFVPQFAFLILKSSFFQAKLTGATRSAQAGFNKGDLADIDFPLPPLAEQHRIVAKVDELMALCDRLEAAQKERENRRDRLVASSLHHLNNGADADAFREHARFYFNHLPRLTTRPDHIKQLRQTILNLAVRGRLTPSLAWPEQPVPLRQLATLQNGYAFKSEWFSRSGVRLLRNVNVSHDVIRWDDLAFLPKIRCAEFERFRLNEGDVVLSLDRPFIVSGTKVARVRSEDLPCLLLQRVGRFQPKLEQLCPEYLFLWLHSPNFTDQINPGRSNGVPHISSKQVESALLFVPSLAGQQRIVTKVNKLMALCNQLETQLTTTQSDSQKLMEAILHEALTG